MRRDLQVAQLQFFSTVKTIIGIIPSFDCGEIYLMTGPVGPFISQHQTSVPLWLALNLKSKNKCRIIPPSWLNVKQLQQIYGRQQRSQNQPIDLHPYFFEISYTILNQAGDDLENSKKLRTLIEGIQIQRQQKLKKLLQGHSTNVRIVNYTSFQINKFHVPLSIIHDSCQKIDNANQK